MRDHETAMMVYVQLALISDERRQPQVRDRFLLLGGVEACRAGWLDVAARCHQRLVESHSIQQVSRYTTFADALRDPEFQGLVAHWERYCPFEKAEAMLRQLNLHNEESSDASVGERLLKLLDAPAN